MEDLSSFIILPVDTLEGNKSFQFISHMITDTMEIPSNEKIYAAVENFIAPNVNIENYSISDPNSTSTESNQPMEVLRLENDGKNCNVEAGNLLECSKCKKIFENQESLVNHLKTHQKNPRFQCLKCEKLFFKSTLYQKHLLTHQEVRLFKCGKCDSSFNFEYNFKIHMALHGNSLVCPICNVQFQRFASFKSHLAMHQVEEIYVCTECSSEFEKEIDLKTHIKTHHREQPIQKNLICNYCKVKFESAAVLKKHISSHVKIKKLVLNGKKIKTPHINNREHKHRCKICNKTFPKLSLLERHIRIHSGERPFVCRICDKGFSQKITLKTHLLKHTALKPYECTLCPAKFNQKCNLKVHVQKTHTATTEGEKIFKCSKCDCIFKRVASLNCHMSKIHASNSQEISVISVFDQVKDINSKHDSDSSNTTSINKDDDNNGLNGGKDEKENLTNETSKIYLLKQKFVGNTKVYVCSYCPKETKKPSDLIRHLRIHTNERPYKCHCGKSFAIKTSLISHMKIHNKKNKKKCLQCSKEFYLNEEDPKEKDDGNIDLENLIANIQCSEELQPSIIIESLYNKLCQKCLKCNKVPDKKFQCQKCFEIYFDEVLFKQHMETHNNSLSFFCEICDQKFPNINLLNQHLSVHTKLFVCHYCKKVFRNLKKYEKHLEIHKQVDLGNELDIIYETENDSQTVTNVNNQSTLFKISTNDDIVDNYFITCDNEIIQENTELVKNKFGSTAVSNTPTILEFEENQDNIQTIILNNADVENGRESNNYFFPQVNLQSNSTIVLNALNNLEQSDTVFNVQDLNNEVFIVKDIEGNECFVNNSTKESNNAVVNLPEVQKNTEICSSNLPISQVDESTVENDLVDNFFANNMSLYPNTEIYFENSIPVNLITVQEENMEVESGNLVSLIENDVPSPSINEDTIDYNVIHCLACTKSFDNFMLYNSHVCLKSVLKKKSNLENQTLIKEQTIDKVVNDNEKRQEKSNLKNQKTSQKIKRHFECVYCKKEFSNRNAYVLHVNKHPRIEDGMHKCTFCDKKFKKPSDLSRHLRTHTGEKPFACDKCDKKFSLKSTLEGHYRTHNPAATKDFICDYCKTFFSSKSSLKQHILVHTGAKPHKCTYCDQYFRTSAHKRGHEQKMHLNRSKKLNQKKAKKIKNIIATIAENNLADVNRNTEEQENLRLNELEMEFPTNTVKLTTPIQIDDNFLQQLQNSNLLLQDVILESSTVDGNENIFQNLEAEMDIDNDNEIESDRVFECEICHKSYACLDVLRKHALLHLKNKFTCHKCNKWFPSLEALSEHEKVHSGNRPFSCFLCNNNFAELQHLKIHLKRMHEIVDTNSSSILKMSKGESLQF